MKTPASVLRIPLHAVLVMIPVGAWILAGFCDFMYLYHGRDSWAWSAFQAYAFGTIVAIAAALPGFVDHAALQGRAARRMGLFHMLSGLLATGLMAASVALRWFDSLVSPLAILIAGTGLIALVVSVALGLYMVHVLAVGVSTETEELVTELPASAHGARDRRSRVATRGALPRRQHHPGH